MRLIHEYLRRCVHYCPCVGCLLLLQATKVLWVNFKVIFKPIQLLGSPWRQKAKWMSIGFYTEIRLLKYGRSVLLIRLMGTNYPPGGSWDAFGAQISLCSFAKIFWFIQCNSVFIFQLLGPFFLLSVECKNYPHLSQNVSDVWSEVAQEMVAIVNPQPGAILVMTWVCLTKSFPSFQSKLWTWRQVLDI